ncbi:hypothetical protein J6590_038399 [Homalodisca vitripennis]|nr:hypothetical protein J6590_038399 [Homalodisca vitripennis]
MFGTGSVALVPGSDVGFCQLSGLHSTLYAFITALPHTALHRHYCTVYYLFHLRAVFVSSPVPHVFADEADKKFFLTP